MFYYKVNSDCLLARTLNLRGNPFANVSENKVLVNISGSTVSNRMTQLVCAVIAYPISVWFVCEV